MLSAELANDLENLYETNKFGYKFLRLDKKPSKELTDFFVKNYNINTDCHYSCITCQIGNISKYKSELDLENDRSIRETGEPLKKWFKTKCSFIPKGIKGDHKQQIQEIVHNLNIDEDRAKKILLSTVDSSAWTELMFGFDDKTKEIDDLSEHWYLRWYQKHILRCTSLRLVARAGRRAGKSSSIALKLIFMIFNKKVFAGYDSNGTRLERGPEIIIITPFSSQIKNIFGSIEKFIKNNKDLEAQVKSRGGRLYTQTPPLKMEFANGASVTGYIAGANAKDDDSGGGAIRGDDADIIYLDEMDMIPESILQTAIMPLILTRPNVIILGTSTPIGKRASFYNWCNNRPDFKEIYAPSTVLPFWDSIEEETLNEGTIDYFKAEYMADFIEQQSGVFKYIYVQQARTDYLYEETDNVDFWQKNFKENYYEFRKCIGIDWNKNAGTEYIVSAFSPRTGNVYILDAVNISSSEFSGERYKEELKRLNYKWRPHYIYPDQGYGHHLIEDLQIESQQLQSKQNKSEWELSICNLYDILKPINFSSNLELFNPATNTYFKKYAKNFLVENTQMFFEKTKIRFPESDTVLLKQLNNYIVVKQLDSGKVIYGQNNEAIGDHRLDALLLSLGGLSIEESIFSNHYSSGTNTYLIENRKDKDDFKTSTEQAFDLLNIIKKQKSGVERNIYSISRGNGEKWLEKELVQGKNNIQSNSELNKGYFSKRGLANFSEKHSNKEDIDIYTPIKINKSKSNYHRRKI